MRELAILTFVTLDGVMQAPGQPEEDFSGDFKHGGWAVPYWSEVMGQVREEAMSAPYDLLLGRRTYEIFAPYWSSSTDAPEAEILNNAVKYVATTTLDDLDWNNSIALKENVAAQIADLKRQDGPLLQVHGSWGLIQTLLAHDLIDEFRLWTFPVVLGSGKRLFGERERPASLSLIKSRSTANGVVMGLYRRSGASSH